MEEVPVKKRLSLLQKMFFICFGLLFAFLLLLVFDRILGWHLNRSGYFYALTPNITVFYNSSEFSTKASINSQGIRNQEVVVPKPSNVYRILTVGDSATFGWGVDLDKTWIKQLQDRLHVQGKKVEVIDAGVPGNALLEDSRDCSIYADRFDADAILVGFNGLDDTVQGQLRVEEDLSPHTETILGKLFPTLSVLPYSRVLHEVEGRQTVFTTKLFWSSEAKIALYHNPTMLNNVSANVKSLFLEGLLNPNMLVGSYTDPQYFVHILNPIFFTRAQKTLAHDFLYLKQHCAGERPLFVLFLPDASLLPSQVGFSAHQEEGFVMDKALANVDFDTPLKNIAKQVGFYYIPTLSEMRKLSCPTCYYPYDGHPTATADAYFAQIAAPQIQPILDRLNK